MRGFFAGAVLLLALTACVGRPADDATGEEIYLQLCARCHGIDLEGGIGPPLGPASNAAAQPDAFLRITIENGRGRMPSFESSLSEDQVDTLIEYLRDEQSE